jgi:hypothetical protein
LGLLMALGFGGRGLPVRPGQPGARIGEALVQVLCALAGDECLGAGEGGRGVRVGVCRDGESGQRQHQDRHGHHDRGDPPREQSAPLGTQQAR